MPPVTSQDLYSFLKTQFSDLPSAKRWARRWIEEQEAGRELEHWGSFSSRAMAAHISRVLEGKEPDSRAALTMYTEETYGPAVYYAMWGWDDDIDHQATPA